MSTQATPCRVIRGSHNIQPHHRGGVATIGNFDGVHVGHQWILSQLSQWAQARQTHTIAIVFEPQPNEFFALNQLRITCFRDKVKALLSHVDYVLVLSFNEKMATLSPTEFIAKHLEPLSLDGLLVGRDFRFGHQRQGDIFTLGAYATENNMLFNVLPTVVQDKEKISSTRVRACLQASDLVGVRRYLGRTFGLSGRVVHGAKKGSELGFPTANIHIRRPPPLQGVFVVLLIRGMDIFPAVANVGVRPTVDGLRLVLEVHALGVSLDLYHQQVSVTFLSKLRSEKKFNSIEELRAAIAQDVEAAKVFFEQSEQTETTMEVIA